MDNSTTNPHNESVPALSGHVSPVILSQESFIEAMEKSQQLNEMDTVMNLTAQYIELEKPSESFRGVFIGIGEISVTDKSTGELKTIPAARFIINKQVFINAGAVLLSEIRRANVPAGTPLEVIYDRKEGNTKIYSIALLA